MMIQLNEQALFALGFDRAGVDALRHLVRQIGSIVGGQTLPETVMEVALQDMGGVVAIVAELRKEVESLRVQFESMAHVAELSKRIDSLQQQVDSERNSGAELTELRKFAQARQIEDAFPDQLTDWEHPGKIGLMMPNTGAFTRASVGAGTVALPSFYMVTETSTGFYRIGANNWGFAVSGARAWEVTASSHFGIGVTPITRLDVAQAGGARVRWDLSGAGSVVASYSNAAGAAFVENHATAASHVFTISGGASKLAVDPTGLVLVNQAASAGAFQFQCTGSAFFNGGMTIASEATVVGRFGCNGKAAQASVALGAAATDLATVIALANTMRDTLNANGIGA